MNATGKRAALLSTSLVALSLSAHAQDRDPAGAEALFREGIALKKAGKLADACPKLDESYKLDPAGGTVFALADCLEAQGRVASAWARFAEAREVARRKANTEKEAESARRMAALESKLPRLIISLAAEQRELAGLEVRRDGIVVGKATFGAALPIDPGPHTIEASAPGKRRWSSRIDVPAGAGSTTVAVPALADEPVAASPAPDAAPPPGAASTAPVAPTPAAPRDEPAPSQTPRYLGYGALAVGAVSLGVAYLYHSKQNGKVDEAAPHCPDGCDDTGKELYKEARSAYTGSLVAGIAGGVLVAGGVVLLVTAPSAKKRAARVWLAPTLGGAAVGGGFW